MNEQDIFVRNLKNLMISRGYSQNELSRQIDLPQATISGVIRGVYTVPWKMIVKVCNHFNVTAKDMFTPSAEQFELAVAGADIAIEMLQDKLKRFKEENEGLRKKLNSYYEPCKDDKVILKRTNHSMKLIKNEEEIPLIRFKAYSNEEGVFAVAEFKFDEVKIDVDNYKKQVQKQENRD